VFDARTTTGVHVDRDPLSLPLETDVDALVAVLSEALGNSTRMVPHPAQSEWKGGFQPILNVAGVRSYRAFMASAALVGVEDDGVQISVPPYRNLAPKAGFEPTHSAREIVIGDHPRTLAQTVLWLLATGNTPD
jgi:hypothetical protein